MKTFDLISVINPNASDEHNNEVLQILKRQQEHLRKMDALNRELEQDIDIKVDNESPKAPRKTMFTMVCKFCCQTRFSPDALASV